MGQLAGIALIWFIIEMLVWYLVAQFTSGWYVFAWFVVAGVVGMILMRKGLSTLNPMAKQMQAGGMMNPGMRPNENSMLKSVAVAVAGILLFIPGLISDLLALFVVLPPVQKKLKDMANNYVMNNQEKMMEMVAKQMGGQSPFGGMGGTGGNNPFGNMNGMNGQNPFGGAGGNNPFGGMGGTGGNNPFGSNSPFGNSSTTVEGTAKTVKKDAKKLTSANDD